MIHTESFLKALKIYDEERARKKELLETGAVGRMFMFRDIAEFWKRPEREDYEKDIEAYLYGRVFA